MHMDVNQVFSGDSLKATDLQGQEHTLMIAGVEMKKFDNGNKLVVRFEGKKKTLVSNKTNSKRIAAMFGPNTDLWIGNEITLYPDQVEFQGDLVDAIRVKIIKQEIKPVPQRKVGGISDAVTDMDDDIPF
jgi:hypothetical protein